jgi:hypothetical protein
MTVRKTSDRITLSLKNNAARLGNLAKEAYDFWVKETPVRSGNARRQTRLQGDTISADYPYARRLDEGWSSQSPQGMSAPTERFIRNRLKRIIRK